MYDIAGRPGDPDLILTAGNVHEDTGMLRIQKEFHFDIIAHMESYLDDIININSVMKVLPHGISYELNALNDGIWSKPTI